MAVETNLSCASQLLSYSTRRNSFDKAMLALANEEGAALSDVCLITYFSKSQKV